MIVSGIFPPILENRLKTILWDFLKNKWSFIVQLILGVLSINLSIGWYLYLAIIPSSFDYLWPSCFNLFVNFLVNKSELYEVLTYVYSQSLDLWFKNWVGRYFHLVWKIAEKKFNSATIFSRQITGNKNQCLRLKIYIQYLSKIFTLSPWYCILPEIVLEHQIYLPYNYIGKKLKKPDCT